VVPKPVRRGVTNVFRNIGFPIRFTNSLLQGKFKRSGTELSRFGINTTIGLLGLFDPAEKWFGLKHHSESFGQTLGHYKVPSGPYIVLPFLGPSSLRDVFGTAGDSFVNPVNRLEHIEDVYKAYAIDTVNTAAENEKDYKKLKSASIDFYSFMKDAYLQRQKQLIAD
jgi:phospholipid-binding lipoprotein MlaA